MGFLFRDKSQTYAPPPTPPAPTMLGQTPQDPPPSTRGRTAVAVNLPGVPETTYLDSEFAPKIDAFIKYAREAGHELRFTSAYRTPEKQQYMIDHHIGTTPAPNSLHKAGLAVDVDFPKESQSIIRNAAERAGLSWGGAFSDPVHFYFDPIPGQDRTDLINNFGEQVRRLQSRQ
ncbi:MAG: hypothetical protein ACM3II_17720 [Rhodospirillaceae bacterium]